jgi:undecaprenyl-diphosphatase
MKKDKIILVLAVLILVISFFMDDKILFLFGNVRNSFFDLSMAWITNFGSLFFVLFLIPTLFSLRERKFNYVFYLWLSFISSIVASLLIKYIVARPRPFEINYLFGLLNYSFPSMHALVAFAAIPILDKEFPKLRTFWILFAFSVAVSRLYFNFHYLSDVVVGALIGYGIGLLFINLEQKYNLYKIVKKK